MRSMFITYVHLLYSYLLGGTDLPISMQVSRLQIFGGGYLAGPLLSFITFR